MLFKPTLKITSILPVLNGETYLKRAIDSFLDQNYPYKELVIVDGKSTDNSHKIIASYVEAFPKEIIWIKEKDTGLSNARNIGLKHATGNIIGFHSSDDVLLRGVFETIGYYGAICDFDILYFSCQIYNTALFECYDSNIPLKKLSAKNLLKGNPITAGECFYYKKHIFDHFKFDENLKCVMDFEFNLQLITNAHHNFFWFAVNKPGIITFLHPDCISNKYKSISSQEKKQVLRKYRAKSKLHPLWKRCLRKLLGMDY